jgi:hypothetical protein
MRLADHVTLNCNSNMSTPAVFFDIEKAFDTTRPSGLLYKLSEFECYTNLIKLTASFLTARKFKVLVEGEFSTPKEIWAGVPQGSVLAPILNILYINDASAAPGTYLSLFADDTCIYATENHESRVLCKLQRGLTVVKSRCERWNIKVNEGKAQAIYFSRRFRVPDDILQLNGRDIPFVNSVMYLRVAFDRKMTWRHRIEKTVAKAFFTHMRTYFLFKSGSLNTNIKLTRFTKL